MRIYLILRKDLAGYDEYDGAVIAAKDAETVRQVMANGCADEGRDMWLDPSRSDVAMIARATTEPAGVVLKSFNAG